MKKKLFIIGIISSFCINIYAQEKTERLNQRDSALPMNKQYKGEIRDLNLSTQQKKQTKILHKSVKQKKEAINNNTTLTQQQKKEKLKQLHKERKEKLNAILTPEQKEKLNEKHQLKRGVTNMPNERTEK